MPQSLPPLTVKQKFTAVAQGCFDPVEFLFIGIQAGIGQADDVNPTYRQGLSGYSKRFGTAYTDAIIGNFGTGAIFPSLLRQDPRYYQLGTGNFFHRFAYAAARVLVSRSDRTGDAELNFSEFLGNGLASRPLQCISSRASHHSQQRQCLEHSGGDGCRRLRIERVLAGHSSLSSARQARQDVSVRFFISLLQICRRKSECEDCKPSE